ncbi:MAG TPA: hypothetical protein VGA97_07610, partial [Acidimicrobiia bacterium]
MLVFSVFVAQLVIAPQTAVAATTGSTVEVASVINTIDFVVLEQNEVQSVSNDASGGTFALSFEGQGPTNPINHDAGLADVDEVQTLYNDAIAGTFTIFFDGQGPTGAIAWNAAAGTVETALESLSNVNDVTVTGSGTMGTPWEITFLDPGSRDVAEITTDDSALVGGTSTVDTTIQGNLSLESALESLSNIGDVSVTGSGTSGDPWLVTFLDPGAMNVDMMTATDALVGGTGTTTITEETAGLSAPIDPAGVVYLGDNLLVSDSEINEEETIFDDVNLWEMITGVMTTPAPSDVVATGVENAPTREPTGLAYNSANGHVYISNDSAPARVTDVDPGVDGIYGNGDVDETITFLKTKPNNCVPFCIDDPEDVAWDPVSGQIFIAGGTGRTLTAVGPGTNGVF